MDPPEPCSVCGRRLKWSYLPNYGFYQDCAVPHPMTVFVKQSPRKWWQVWKLYELPKYMAINIPIPLPGATNEQVHTILSLVSIAENSTTEWWTKFNYCENIHDGRGYTVGLFGACSGTGDLLQMVQEVQKINPSHVMCQFIPTLKKIKGSKTHGLELMPSVIATLNEDRTWQIATFKILLKLYWKPAFDLCAKNKMPSPASLGFMYDIALNHGADVLEKLCQGLASAGSETSKLSKLIQHRVLEISNDPSTNPGQHGEPQYDRCTMWHTLLNNLSLTLPIHCTCYGEKFTI